MRFVRLRSWGEIESAQIPLSSSPAGSWSEECVCERCTATPERKKMNCPSEQVIFDPCEVKLNLTEVLMAVALSHRWRVPQDWGRGWSGLVLGGERGRSPRVLPSQLRVACERTSGIIDEAQPCIFTVMGNIYTVAIKKYVNVWMSLH